MYVNPNLPIYWSWVSDLSINIEEMAEFIGLLSSTWTFNSEEKRTSWPSSLVLSWQITTRKAGPILSPDRHAPRILTYVSAPLKLSKRERREWQWLACSRIFNPLAKVRIRLGKRQRGFQLLSLEAMPRKTCIAFYKLFL